VEEVVDQLFFLLVLVVHLADLEEVVHIKVVELVLVTHRRLVLLKEIMVAVDHLILLQEVEAVVEEEQLEQEALLQDLLMVDQVDQVLQLQFQQVQLLMLVVEEVEEPVEVVLVD
jgi:hypothetical protein